MEDPQLLFGLIERLQSDTRPEKHFTFFAPDLVGLNPWPEFCIVNELGLHSPKFSTMARKSAVA